MGTFWQIRLHFTPNSKLEEGAGQADQIGFRLVGTFFEWAKKL